MMLARPSSPTSINIRKDIGNLGLRTGLVASVLHALPGPRHFKYGPGYLACLKPAFLAEPNVARQAGLGLRADERPGHSLLVDCSEQADIDRLRRALSATADVF